MQMPLAFPLCRKNAPCRPITLDFYALVYYARARARARVLDKLQISR